MTSSETSSQSSKYSVKHLNAVFEKLKGNQVRESTKANYMSIWRNFNKFLLKLDTSQWKVSWEQRVVLFGTHLVDQGAQSQTVKSYFSAIKHVLKTDGYPWDDSKVLLNTITRSCRLVNDRVKIRFPIRLRLLEVLLFETERYFMKQPYLEKLYKAIFALAYYGLMRIGEIAAGNHPVKAQDVHVGTNKDKILILLRSSKTHGKESIPQKIKISGISGSTKIKHFCPFKIVRSYVAIRGNYEMDDENFFVFGDGQSIKPSIIRETLREMLSRLSLNAELYDCTSFRIGRCTDLIENGYSLTYVRKAGRWRSNAIFRYLKP